MGGISISKQVSMPSPQKSEGMFGFHSCDRHPAGEILRFGFAHGFSLLLKGGQLEQLTS